LSRNLRRRALRAATPFLFYFVWRAWMNTRGREARPPPWGWLIAAAGVLVGLSIIATVIVTPTNLGRRYVPAVTLPDGSIKPGYYE
jgi:hypothetical protein